MRDDNNKKLKRMKRLSKVKEAKLLQELCYVRKEFLFREQNLMLEGVA